MVSDTLEQRIYELVRSHDGIYLFKKKELTPSTDLDSDLRLEDDEALALMDDFFTTFNVDKGNFSITTYYPPEPPLKHLLNPFRKNDIPQVQQVHQATGGIVNIDKSSTGSPPVFKPVMVTAINLYQLASTRPPVTRLMNFRRTLSARDPDSGFYHEASDSFLAKNQTVNFLQIFPRQRGVKITVVLPDYTECLIYQ